MTKTHTPLDRRKGDAGCICQEFNPSIWENAAIRGSDDAVEFSLSWKVC